LVEVVKMGALLDPELFACVEADLDRLLGGDPGALGPVVAGADAAKIGVVERDPTEQGDRKLLNFGHTLGHAIESSLGYGGLRHGEAVGYGMLFALRLALRRGLDPAVAGRIRALLARFGLPPLPTLDPAALLAHMARDKKALEGGLVWVLPAAMGEGRMVQGIGREELTAELARFLEDPFAEQVADRL
jgi:3-dehydroquinate synthase